MADEAGAAEAGADDSAAGAAADSAEEASVVAAFLQAARPKAATPARASARVTDFFMEFSSREFPQVGRPTRGQTATLRTYHAQRIVQVLVRSA
jgi:hypothetical protein